MFLFQTNCPSSNFATLLNKPSHNLTKVLDGKHHVQAGRRGANTEARRGDARDGSRVKKKITGRREGV